MYLLYNVLRTIPSQHTPRHRRRSSSFPPPRSVLPVRSRPPLWMFISRESPTHGTTTPCNPRRYPQCGNYADGCFFLDVSLPHYGYYNKRADGVPFPTSGKMANIRHYVRLCRNEFKPRHFSIKEAWERRHACDRKGNPQDRSQSDNGLAHTPSIALPRRFRRGERRTLPPRHPPLPPPVAPARIVG